MKIFVETCPDCGAKYYAGTPEYTAAMLRRHKVRCPLQNDASSGADVIWWRKLREDSDAGFTERLNDFDRVWLPAMGISVEGSGKELT
jgi:hypothetical protein